MSYNGIWISQDRLWLSCSPGGVGYIPDDNGGYTYQKFVHGGSGGGGPVVPREVAKEIWERDYTRYAWDLLRQLGWDDVAQELKRFVIGQGA